MTWKLKLLRVVLGIAGPLAAGCGGDGQSGPTCGAAACGGDVVGSWSYTSACQDRNALLAQQIAQSSCPQETVDESGIQETIIIVFKNDGTYAETVTASGTYSWSVPAQCLTSPFLSCATDEQLLQQELAQPSSVIQAGSCQTSGGTGCACSIDYNPNVPIISSGTYSTAGNKLTITDGQGMATVNDYCVEASALHVLSATAGESLFLRQ